jgi:hypothetical protein
MLRIYTRQTGGVIPPFITKYLLAAFLLHPRVEVVEMTVVVATVVRVGMVEAVGMAVVAEMMVAGVPPRSLGILLMPE